MSLGKQNFRSSDQLLLKLLKEPQPSEPLVLDFSNGFKNQRRKKFSNLRRSLEAIYQDLKNSVSAHFYFFEPTFKEDNSENNFPNKSSSRKFGYKNHTP
jgi:hypothetical protein